MAGDATRPCTARPRRVGSRPSGSSVCLQVQAGCTWPVRVSLSVQPGLPAPTAPRAHVRPVLGSAAWLWQDLKLESAACREASSLALEVGALLARAGWPHRARTGTQALRLQRLPAGTAVAGHGAAGRRCRRPGPAKVSATRATLACAWPLSLLTGWPCSRIKGSRTGPLLARCVLLTGTQQLFWVPLRPSRLGSSS